MIPYSRPKLPDLYTLSQSKLLENHSLHSGTYLYIPHKAEPPRDETFSREMLHGLSVIVILRLELNFLFTGQILRKKCITVNDIIDDRGGPRGGVFSDNCDKLHKTDMHSANTSPQYTVYNSNLVPRALFPVVYRMWSCANSVHPQILGVWWSCDRPMPGPFPVPPPKPNSRP